MNYEIPAYGSDVVAATLRDLGLRYIALNPGASYRGIHDSLVNFTDGDPKILLCIHEEAAVAIAHGWAKVAGHAMAVALHSNVGLMHGSMGIFNAFCDRVPMVVIGATGPVDAAKRRPWIEWIHTAQDQGALIRDFIKWDDQPGGIEATRNALLQGSSIAHTAPRGPVYINIDAALQEKKLDESLAPFDPDRHRAPQAATPDPALVAQAISLLAGQKNIVVMFGRMSRNADDWARRVRLVEALGARALSDFKAGATFPSDHPAKTGKAGYFLDEAAKDALRQADVIVNFDWIDFGGTVRSVIADEGMATTRILSATLDSHAHRGWSKDGGAPYPCDLAFLNEPDQVVAALVAQLAIPPKAPPRPTASTEAGPSETETNNSDAPLTPQAIAKILRSAMGDRQACLTRGPLSWTEEDWPMNHPLAALGYDGGGGVGSGSGMAVGAALALRDQGSDLLPLAVLGDGDFLMNASALWTAVANKIPLLVVVLNNRSFYNDEVHQDAVAKERGRPPENRHIGIALTGPLINVSAIATGFGAWSPSVLNDEDSIRVAFSTALEKVAGGGVAVLEIETAKGYSPAMASALKGKA